MCLALLLIVTNYKLSVVIHNWINWLVIVSVERRLILVLNGREAIVDALVNHGEDFADRCPLWTEEHCLNKQLRGEYCIFMYDVSMCTSKYFKQRILQLL